MSLQLPSCDVPKPITGIRAPCADKVGMLMVLDFLLRGTRVAHLARHSYLYTEQRPVTYHCPVVKSAGGVAARSTMRKAIIRSIEWPMATESSRTVPVDEARALAERALMSIGFPRDEARIITDHLIDSALCG